MTECQGLINGTAFLAVGQKITGPEKQVEMWVLVHESQSFSWTYTILNLIYLREKGVALVQRSKKQAVIQENRQYSFRVDCVDRIQIPKFALIDPGVQCVSCGDFTDIVAGNSSIDVQFPKWLSQAKPSLSQAKWRSSPIGADKRAVRLCPEVQWQLCSVLVHTMTSMQ